MNILTKPNIIGVLIVVFACFNMGCKKFLDEKSDQKLAVPTTLEDLQALMDNTQGTNESGPSEGEAGSDDHYISDADWANLTYETDKILYNWGNRLTFIDKYSSGWSLGYGTIYYCNSVLEGLKKIDPAAQQTRQFKDIKGQAHFMRANAFFDMAMIWCKLYNEESAATDLGLPLHLISNFNVKLERASLKQTYEQIMGDLSMAKNLLSNAPVSKWRSSRSACYGLLARIYLSMRDYEKAYLNADSCLELSGNLLDFNTLDSTLNIPILRNNVEVIFNRSLQTTDPLNALTARMSEDLYKSYAANDLRRPIFYRVRPDGAFRFKGSYLEGASLFSGIATDELYLTRAECLARKGLIEEAMTDLNKLLINRWKKKNGVSTFVDLKANSQTEALSLILEHRRKELVRRGTRWMDIRRLNKEGANISLKRTINGQLYQLPANDKRFVLPIPADVIRLSGMQQN